MEHINEVSGVRLGEITKDRSDRLQRVVAAVSKIDAEKANLDARRNELVLESFRLEGELRLLNTMSLPKAPPPPPTPSLPVVTEPPPAVPET